MRPGVGRAAPGKRKPGHGKCREDIRVLPYHLLGSACNLGRIAESSTLRRLLHHDQIVLVFAGDERSRHMLIHIDRQPQTPKEDQQHQVANLQNPMHDHAIAAPQARIPSSMPCASLL